MHFFRIKSRAAAPKVEVQKEKFCLLLFLIFAFLLLWCSEHPFWHRNLTSVSSTQCQQPRPTRRGIRRGSTPYDPVYVEAPMASPASAPKGPSSSASRACRPRCENQPSSRGSSLIGACRMPEPTSLPSPGSLSMSRAWMVGQLAHYSRPSLFTALRDNSVLTLTANFNAVSGSLLTSSLGVGGQGERYGPLPSNYLAMLASTSNLNSDAHDASNDYNSNPLFTAAVGLSAVGASATINRSSSSQEMASDESSNVVKPETVGQPSTPATASNLQTDIKMETNEEVSSAAKESNMKEAGVEELQQKENDTDVGDYLNDNNGYENEVYSYAFMPATQQPEVPQMQPQPSHSVEVRDEGFEFKLEACLESNLVELWCCHFSSTGKYLACAGIDRKVTVWNMGTFVYTVSEEHHQEAIVDVRFKSNSPIFASASLDTTIRIWDANEPERSLVHLTGHTASVTSVDFHPTHVDLLCSCDGNKEIRLWNISNGACLHVIKGASQQARFQAQKGIYLAAVAGNTINILDTETLTIVHTLEGHIQPVECLCWDPSGRYLASASQESIHIWSVSSLPNSMHKLTAESGSKFKFCVFHPRTTHVVIISSDKNIEIWNPMGSGKTVVVPAHDSYVAGLTSSICTDMIASVGKDCHVKLWK